MARHFFLDRRTIRKDRAFITGDEARHITAVLRRDVGDALRLIDQEGWEYSAIINASSPHRIGVVLIDRRPPSEAPARRIILGQALPKFQKMDYIVQKATELGVSAIIPFVSSRSIGRLRADQLHNKQLRWQKIAREAIKQSGRRLVPAIEKVQSFHDIVQSEHNNCLKIILWEDEKIMGLKELVSRSRHCTNTIVLVGPEGGFGAGEVDRAVACGYQPVSLGSHIMRTETASLYVLSVLHYEGQG
jgi:16S rRNA (uracil1498-N3)-methyltransferase